jgi:RNA-binding protein Musashi
VQIDPKRAIPREEQERTSKIFVGGVSQEATEEDFTKFFKQFGRVVDATLMMDKETGRPRGFGFVTFDGDAAVDATLRQPLQILGKPIEVKRAQPRGNMRDEDGGDKKFGRNNNNNKFNNRDQGGNGNNNGGYDNQQSAPQQGANGAMTPAMMAQYWQRMQQYFQQMQQNLAQQQVGGGGMPNPMGAMGGMNPMAMQQMQAQMMGGGGPGMNRNTGSPNPQNMMGGPGGMNPMAMQQMMQGGGGPGGFPTGPSGPSNQGTSTPNAASRPAYTPQDQLAFEQQKYEQQQQRRMQQQAGGAAYGGPTAWEGMYEDMPQPGGPAGRGGGFKNQRGRQGSSQPPSAPANAPINAPTGPKNAGKPGANYRGGGRHTGAFRHQPYGGRGG